MKIEFYYIETISGEFLIFRKETREHINIRYIDTVPTEDIAVNKVNNLNEQTAQKTYNQLSLFR